ncbi:MAG: hypothetical protein ACC609_00235 [Methanobacterium formicicum]
MKKSLIFITILLFIISICCSGCIDSTKANNTWGEKKISLDAIKIGNDTVGNRSENNDSIYYVYGNITNQNSFEALETKIRVTTYYVNGTVFAINDTPRLNPQNIPANGQSYFYARFVDPNKQIVKYDVKIISAKGEY